jgi:hypothetical protein
LFFVENRLNLTNHNFNKMQLERKGQKLIFASIVFAIAISYPFLTLANTKKNWHHIPVLYLYLFGAWVLFILWVAVIADRKSRK